MEEDKYVDQVKYFPEVFRTFTLYARTVTIVSAVFCGVAVSREQYQVSSQHHSAFKSHIMRSCANEVWDTTIYFDITIHLLFGYQEKHWPLWFAVTLCSCCQGTGSSPRESPGCGTQTFQLGREQTAHVVTDQHRPFFYPFVCHFSWTACISIHTSFISIFYFKLQVIMTSKYATEMAWMTANP